MNFNIYFGHTSFLLILPAIILQGLINHTNAQRFYQSYRGAKSSIRREVPSVFTLNANCQLPKQVGTCRGSILRWRFNSETGLCETFFYGGCGGNRNNFVSESECRRSCSLDYADKMGPCAREKASSEETNFNSIAGRFTPQCTTKGYYSLIQCAPASRSCWCVDPRTGKETPNTRKRGGNVIECPICHTLVSKALHQNREPFLKCAKNGKFDTIQCSSITQDCWCVNPDNGAVIRGTRLTTSGTGPICENPFADSGPIAQTVKITVQPTQPPTTTIRPRKTISEATHPPSISSTQSTSSVKPTIVEIKSTLNIETTGTTEPMGPCHQVLQEFSMSSTRDSSTQQPITVPACTPRGFFLVTQCDERSGTCWCVDPEGGSGVGAKKVIGKPKCGACYLSKQELFRNGYPSSDDYVPFCDNLGNFVPTQCHTSLNLCWCVDSKTGAEIEGSRVGNGHFPSCTQSTTQENSSPATTAAKPSTTVTIPTTSPPTTAKPPKTSSKIATEKPVSTMPPIIVFPTGPCEEESRAWLAAPVLGKREPSCTERGFYELVQCSGSTGFCWCVDVTSGREVPGTRLRSSQSPPICPACYEEKALSYARGHPPAGNFVPQCHESGFYERLQCHSTGFCWCVDPESGKELIGTRRGPSQVPPTCLPEQGEESGATTVVTTKKEEITNSITDFPSDDAPTKPEGPCRRNLDSPYALRCTTGGFFELAQCHSFSGQCWCVDPVTGAESLGTRVDSEQPLLCPECLQRKADAYRTRRPPPGAFVYQCEADGLYTQKQCHASSGHCWCVNTTNGQEIPGSRQVQLSEKLDCTSVSPLPLSTPTQPATTSTLATTEVPSTQAPNFRESKGTTRNEGPSAKQSSTTPEDNRILRGACALARRDAIEVGSSYLPNCERHGRFVPAQCDPGKDECFCVHRESGQEVPGSRRSFSNETAPPLCGECLSLLNAVAMGIVPRPQHLPFCDEFGDFSPMQCNETIGECWCVQSDSGTFIPDTLRSTGSDGVPCLGRLESLAEDSIQKRTEAPTTEFFPLGPGPVVLTNEMVCKSPKEPGSCDQSLLRWYFDEKHQECLAFMFTGCNGNLNNFESHEACSERCKILDGSPCSGNLPPHQNSSSGEYTICRGPQGCPEDYICRMGAFFGSCCNRAAEELYGKNYNPKCESDEEVVKITLNRFPFPLLGSDCADSFCPQKSTCRFGGLFAHCCAPIQAPETTTVVTTMETTTERVIENFEDAATIDDRCLKDLDVGFVPIGMAPLVRFYYDKRAKLCIKFLYYGSSPPQNGNSFDSLQICNRACGISKDQNDTPTKAPVQMTTQSSVARCNLPSEVGQCKAQILSWYYDTELKECLAFMYGGCGGNANRFDTLADCQNTCKMMDGTPCAGNMEDHVDPEKPLYTCNATFDCPQGFTCRRGVFFSFCCNATIQDAFERSYSPKCSQGGAAIKIPAGGIKVTLFGRSCSANFCPAQTDCEMGPKFAYCCSREEPQDEVESVLENSILDGPQEPSFIPPAVKTDAPDPLIGEETIGNLKFENITNLLEPNCFDSKDPGPCTGRVLKWYFDSRYQECLAFSYGGCGGNRNLFGSREECVSSCGRDRKPQCAGNGPPLVDSFSGVQISCSVEEDNCPQDFVCRQGEFTNTCCEASTEELFKRNLEPECRENMHLHVLETTSGDVVPILGDRCADNFCPEGTSCYQGELFAYCCGDRKPQCAGNGPPLVDSFSGVQISCSVEEDNCPQDFVCRQGEFTNTCCEASTEELFKRNLEPECRENMHLHVLETTSGDVVPILGDRCADNFCPEGTSCYQGELFAYCCGED